MTSQQDLDIDTRGGRPAFFENADVDALMTALLEVMAQLWATRDYAHALERLLVERGVLAEGDIDRFEWTPEQVAGNDAARQAFLQDAFRAIGASFETVAARNADIDRGNTENT